MRSFLKICFRAMFLVIALPMALLSGFGRLQPLFEFWAQFCALVPSLPGDYLRVAYYRLTLEECAAESRIQFGTFFSRREAQVARDVYIGSYCVLGMVRIGQRTQIASGVQILSGRRQHQRDAESHIGSSQYSAFKEVRLGDDCWIGAGAIVMADVGDGTTVGAGSIVVHPLPPDSVAVGNPARVVRQTDRSPA